MTVYDQDDYLEGCDVVLESTDWLDADDVPFVCLFAGVPDDELAEVAAFWRWLAARAEAEGVSVHDVARRFRRDFPPRHSSELWLADAARDWGLDVVEVNGWQSRSAGSFDPQGGVAHHTAGPSGGGDMPSLNTLINGRPDLSGPLANYGLGRSGTVYVVAAGRANHAGSGGWNGLSGNSSVIGIEAENDGYQDWPQAQLDAYATLAAACCAFANISPDNWCRHHEWRSEKPDPHDLDGPTGRAAIAERLVAGPHPNTTAPQEDDDVGFLLVTNAAGTQHLISDAGLDAIINDPPSSQALQNAGVKLAPLDDDTCRAVTDALRDVRAGNG